MGALSVTALDPNAEAIQTTISNIQLNRVEKAVRPLQGDLKTLDEHDFDLIMANLYGDILLTLAGMFPSFLKPVGYLLLSGIQYEYSYEVKTAIMKSGCRLVKSKYLEEYTTLVFRKEPDS